MKKPAGSWPKSPSNQCVVFVMQYFHELLFERSWDCDRVYAFDCVSRIAETIFLGTQVEEKGARPGTFDSSFDETLHFLKQLDLVKKTKNPNMLEVLNLASKANEVSDKVAYLNLILNQIAPKYEQHLEMQILSLCENAGSKDDLRKKCNEYVSLKINRGYSRSHILECVDAILKKTYLRMGNTPLRWFFRQLAGKRREFYVYFMLPRILHRVLLKLNIDAYRKFDQVSRPHRKLIEGNFSFGADRKKNVLCRLNVETKDHFQARYYAYEILSAIKSLSVLSPETVPIKHYQNAVVFDGENGVGRVIGVPSRPTRRNYRPTFPTALGHVVEVASTAARMRDPDRGLLFSALEAAVAADNSEALGTQIVSLWSSLELLISRFPQDGNSKIGWVKKNLLPAMCIGYVERNFEVVYRRARSEAQQITEDLIKEHCGSELSFPGFMSLFINTEDDTVFDAYTPLANSNPLLLNRLSLLRKRFSQEKKMRNEMTRHRQLVEWQLNRIYGVRNSIVHSGELTPVPMDILSMNMISYIVEVINSLCKVASLSNSSSIRLQDMIIQGRGLWNEKLSWIEEGDFTCLQNDDLGRFSYLLYIRRGE